MPIGTCDPATRGEAYNEVALEYPLPNRSGSVLAEIRYEWDGVSVRPDCDGPIIYLRTRNTGTQTAWALMPMKRKPPKWVQIDPGTDITITSTGQFKQLGLDNISDVGAINIVFVQPV